MQFWGIRRLLVVSSIGRWSFAITPLALIVTLRDTGGSYAEAGVSLALFGLTSGLLAPWRGRLVDRRGPATVTAFAVAYALVLTALALGAEHAVSVSVLLALSALGGSLAPPIGAYTRASIGLRLGDRARAAYAADALLDQILFVVGPPTCAGIILLAGSSTSLVAGSVASVASAAGLVALTRGATTPAERGLHPSWMSIALILAVLPAAGLGAALAAMEVSVVSFADARGSASTGGFYMAALAAGGCAGAVILGRRESVADVRWQFAACVLVLVIASWPMTAISEPVVLVVLLAAAGSVVPPAFSILYAWIDQTIGPGRTQAFAWLTTMNNVGLAAGAAAAGSLIAHRGTAYGFAVAAATATVTLLAAGRTAQRARRARRP